MLSTSSRTATNTYGVSNRVSVNACFPEWFKNRTPTPIDHQPVIRQNRDTLYSGTITDITEGATLTIPECGDRYVSAMVVNQDHHVGTVRVSWPSTTSASSGIE